MYAIFVCLCIYLSLMIFSKISLYKEISLTITFLNNAPDLQLWYSKSGLQWWHLCPDTTLQKLNAFDWNISPFKEKEILYSLYIISFISHWKISSIARSHFWFRYTHTHTTTFLPHCYVKFFTLGLEISALPFTMVNCHIQRRPDCRRLLWTTRTTPEWIFLCSLASSTEKTFLALRGSGNFFQIWPARASKP